MRRRGPLVHCLTNVVAAPWTANVLLASGASPAMVDHPGEAGRFAGRADALLVNLGTLKEPAAMAMSRAVAGAAEGGTPWVLDPVGIGGLPWRTGVAKDLLEQATPSIVRGNASEILALAGGEGGRGPESVDTPEDALGAAAVLAREHHTVVAVSGRVDHVTNGQRLVRVGHGHPWLTRVTGAGCALGALMAAVAAQDGAGQEGCSTPGPLLAATAATTAYTVAAELAAARASGPGSFAVALLDTLADLSPDQLADRAVLR